MGDTEQMIDVPHKDDLSLKDLGQYYGTTQYHNIMGMQCTDGVDYIFNNGYGWFVTDSIVILQHVQKVTREEFVAVKLKLDEDGDGAVVEYSDGNGNILHEQKYEYTDAKQSLTLFRVGGVYLLSGEY